VFIEPHQYCIRYALLTLGQYADEHGGKYPSHPKGYPSALLLLRDDCFNTLTGPSYDPAIFHEAKRSGRELAEDECGRVYIQGLTKKPDAKIAILFDKRATPGGDHCYWPVRMWAPLLREVLFADGDEKRILESDWPALAAEQIELLVKQGFDRREAERLYALTPTTPSRFESAWLAAGAALLALPITLVAWRRTRKLRAT
jgi:hypothetical protein